MLNVKLYWKNITFITTTWLGAYKRVLSSQSVPCVRRGCSTLMYTKPSHFKACLRFQSKKRHKNTCVRLHFGVQNLSKMQHKCILVNWTLTCSNVHAMYTVDNTCLSRTDHNKHSACECKRLHKYGEKFNASIQIMVKRLTSKTVVLMFLTIIQYNTHTWSVHTQLLLHTVSLRGYISQSYTWISIRLVQKQWEKGKKCILCYTLYFDIPGLPVLKQYKVHKH